MKQSEQHIKKLLQRWVTGDITAREEAELRAAAKEDPFLAASLEGYEQDVAADHAAALAGIRRKLHKKRESSGVVHPARQSTPVSHRTWWRVAAAVALLVIASLAVWRFPMRDQMAPTTAQMEKVATEPTEIASEVVIPATEAPKDTKTEEPLAQINQTSPQRSPTPPPSVGQPVSISIDSFAAASQNDYVNVSQPTLDDLLALEEIVDTSPVPIGSSVSEDTVLSFEAEEAADDQIATTMPAQAAKQQESARYFPAPPPILTDESPVQEDIQLADRISNSAVPVPLAQERLVQGVVVDENGELLIGANILLPNGSSGTVTDFDGSFEFVLPDEETAIEVSYTGFESQTIALPTGDQRLTITLAEGPALSEVVVTGRSASQQAYDPPSATIVQPQEGYRQLRNYIRDNTPDGTPRGNVKVWFTLSRNGQPQQMTVVRSSDPALEPLALRLLAQGPVWEVLEGTFPVEVTYVVKFR